jgi:REP element-mobilizing transposase RayT
MARLPRIYVEGILYYVTSKGGHNQNIFLAPSDYNEYISLINRYKSQYGFKLFSYVLMPTHLHLLIELKNNIGISNIMHDINSLYTKSYNSKYNKEGHLFQSRFKTTFAHKETNLLPLTRHIHLHPKADKMVFEPKDYPYSSHAQYVGAAEGIYPDMKREIEEAFRLLKGGGADFDRYVKEAGTKELNDFKKKLRKKRILGPRYFEERLKKIMAKSAEEIKRTRNLSRVHRISMAVGGALLVMIAALSGVFIKRHMELVDEYDKTLTVYYRTIRMLKAEREKALAANEDVEEYAWKIRVAEESLSDLKRERETAARLRGEIDGFSWKIGLRQIGGSGGAYRPTDTLTFKDNRVSSANLTKHGFGSTNYSKRRLTNGKVAWETIQRNKKGETASWRGEWDGEVMKGVVSMRDSAGTRRAFAFKATGEKKEIN